MSQLINFVSDILEFSNGEYEFEKEIENISFNVMVEKSVLIKKATIDNSNPNFINITKKPSIIELSIIKSSLSIFLFIFYKKDFQ